MQFHPIFHECVTRLRDYLRYVDKAPQGTADHGRATAELVEQRSILYKVREKLVATDARRDSILKQSKEIQDERMALVLAVSFPSFPV